MIPRFTHAKRTVAGDLGFGLSVLVTLAFLLLGTVNFFFSYNRELENLDTKAGELLVSATEVLTSPVWNIDDREIQRIVGIFLQSDIITAAKLVDEHGQTMLERWKSRETPRLTLTRPVERNGAVIGQLTLWFTDATIRQKQTDTLIFLAMALALAISAVNIGTRKLMKRYLRDPLDRLIRGLDVIASGDYRLQLPNAAQEEVNRINNSVNSMARDLSIREAALADNRQRMEILNGAIMDIFSGHDSNSLIDQALRSTVRLGKASIAAFIPAKDSQDPHYDAPSPRLFLDGQLIAKFLDQPPVALQTEIDRAFSAIPENRVYRFSLKSRQRLIGEFILGFDAPLESHAHGLLKSIASLATVAMVRQSFIHESALMTAEMKVAESVQRANLGGSGKNPGGLQSDLAFHYEPVLRVGGDWTNVIEAPAQRAIYVMMGDVTGHGIAQSMITAAVSGALESLRSLMGSHDNIAVNRPSQILELIQCVVDKVAADSNLQMTCAVLKVDYQQQTVTIANAGHQFPVILEPSKSGLMKARALTGGLQPILGMNHSLNNSLNQSLNHNLKNDPQNKAEARGDATYAFPAAARLVVFTDGLVDGRSKGGKTFHRTFVRCLAALKSSFSSTAIKDEIISDFRRHTSGGKVSDDVCLVVIAAAGQT